jgi:hypothetical protein
MLGEVNMPHKNLLVRREYQRKYQEEWRKSHVTQVKEYRNKAESHRPIRKDTEIRRTAHQRKLIRAKLKVFETYGKKCVWCGEDRFELLCIDHIHNDGSIHRRELRGSNIYEWLENQPYQPERFQVLCHNCNSAKAYFGILPGVIEYMSWEYWKEFSAKRRK